MKSNERTWLLGIIGFLLGIVATVIFAANAVNSNSVGQMQMMGMHTSQMRMNNHRDDKDENEQHMMPDGTMMSKKTMTMNDMVSILNGKTGDDFDKAFLSSMIEHHQGAIDMAKKVNANAKHDELKSMADEIISAQTSEIEQMKTWQKDWGY